MAQNSDSIVANSGGTLVAGAVLVVGECVVRGLHVTHASGSAGVIQVFDAASEPADGQVPLVSHQVDGNSDADIETFHEYVFTNGVYVCESTTVATKTISGSADLFITVSYVIR